MVDSSLRNSLSKPLEIVYTLQTAIRHQLRDERECVRIEQGEIIMKTWLKKIMRDKSFLHEFVRLCLIFYFPPPFHYQKQKENVLLFSINSSDCVVDFFLEPTLYPIQYAYTLLRLLINPIFIMAISIL